MVDDVSLGGATMLPVPRGLGFADVAEASEREVGTKREDFDSKAVAAIFRPLLIRLIERNDAGSEGSKDVSSILNRFLRDIVFVKRPRRCLVMKRNRLESSLPSSLQRLRKKIFSWKESPGDAIA